MSSEGIPIAYFDRYMAYWKTFTNISGHKEYGKISSALEVAAFIPKNKATVKNFDFDVGKPGILDSVVVVTGSDFTKFTVVTSITNGAFKLAPDMVIWNKTLSAAGGIYESDSDKIRYTPRNISKAEAESIGALMILSGLETLNKEVGAGLQLPTQP